MSQQPKQPEDVCKGNYRRLLLIYYRASFSREIDPAQLGFHIFGLTKTLSTIQTNKTEK